MKKVLNSNLLIPAIYILGITIFAICLVTFGSSLKEYSKDTELERSKTVFGEDVTLPSNNIVVEPEVVSPVISSTTTIIKPYTDSSVKLSKSFYDKDSESTTQEKSLIFYGNTYMQNMGSEYSSNKSFDVINIIDGTITSISKDDITLYTVEVRHDNNLTTVYEYLDKVIVKEGSSIKKGDKIGTSGKSKVNNDDKYTLHFEVYHKGEPINPETLYTMKVEDFN